MINLFLVILGGSFLYCIYEKFRTRYSVVETEYSKDKEYEEERVNINLGSKGIPHSVSKPTYDRGKNMVYKKLAKWYKESEDYIKDDIIIIFADIIYRKEKNSLSFINEYAEVYKDKKIICECNGIKEDDIEAFNDIALKLVAKKYLEK